MDAANAALIDRGSGMVYDSTRNITWLADMNYAATSGYAAANAGGTGSTRISSNGRMGWGAAVAWADGLVFGGFSDWRLPTLNPADTTCSDSRQLGGFPREYFGTNCTGGELSGLFVTDLGNKAGESVLNQSGDTAEQVVNLSLFRIDHSALRINNFWSSTEVVAQDFGLPLIGAWGFSSDLGDQRSIDKRALSYAVAVRNGDVAAVSESATLALVGAAFLGAIAAGRRRSAAPASPVGLRGLGSL